MKVTSAYIKDSQTGLPDWAKSGKLSYFFMLLLTTFMTSNLAAFWTAFKI